jgi:type I restriction enzyme M protein
LTVSALPEDLLAKQALENLQKANVALDKNDTITALILVDQALETFLKSCCIFLGAEEATKVKFADGKEKSFERWGLAECILFLDEHDFLTPEEKSNFFTFHGWRNSVQHFGIEPSRKQVTTVIESISDFIRSQLEARKQPGVTPPTIRRFAKSIREMDPESRIITLQPEKRQVRYDPSIVQHRRISDLTDEELVRAYLVTRLSTILKYPLGAIELEKPVKLGRKEKQTEGRIDVLVTKNGKPFMLVETKRPVKYQEELDRSIETQLFPAAYIQDMNRQTVRYLVYYTAYVTEEAGVVEKLVTVDFKRFPSFDSWVKDGRPNLLLVPKEYGIVRKPIFLKGGANDLRPNVSKRELDSIRWSLHNILYGGGKYQTELFFNLLGLFLAKIYDEKNTANGEPYQFQIAYKDGDLESPDEVYEKVDKLYHQALSSFLGYSQKELERETGIAFDAPKVKYVVDILQAISLTASTYDVLGDFFEKIVWGEFRQSKGQYLTHPNIVSFMIRALSIENLAISLINEDLRLPYVIDPACGSGTFLIETMKLTTSAIMNSPEKLKKSASVREFIGASFPLEKENKWANEYVYGIENNRDLALATKVNMVMHGDGSANIEAKDALIAFSDYSKSMLVRSTKNESYKKPVNEMFDVVVSNPPFSITIDRDTAETLPANFTWGEKIADSLKRQTKKKEVSVETLFLERWYQLLRPGGRLGAVLPETIFTAVDTEHVRLFLYRYFHVKAIVSLPYLAFQPYTSTKTSLLFAQKKIPAEVEHYDDVWNKYRDEFQKLRQIVFSITRENAGTLEHFSKDMQYRGVQAIRRLLGRMMSRTEDDDLGKIVTAHSEEIDDMDENWWVFQQTASELDYPIVMAHASEIGYKRLRARAGGEEERPNDLFSTRDGQIVTDDPPTTILDHIRKSVTWEEPVRRSLEQASRGSDN